MSTACPCGSGRALTDCCSRYHLGALAENAESLMRSRYSAYVLGLIDYLIDSTLPVQQAGLNREAIEAWSRQSQWLGLTVESAETIGGQAAHAFVTFVARWQEPDGPHSQRERSAFVQVGQRWYFIDPSVPLKAGRNDPCPCGSGQKFKKCCAAYLA